MTRQREFEGYENAQSKHYRRQKGLTSEIVDVTDIDRVVFRYGSGWFFTVEEKAWGGSPTAAQMDTQMIVAQMLARASGMECETLRGRRPIEYKGHFIFSFSGAAADEGPITVTGPLPECKESRVIDEAVWINLHKFGSLKMALLMAKAVPS